MNVGSKRDVVLVTVFCALGAVAFLALAVYPFQYGPVESAAVAAGVVEFVMDEATFGDDSS